MIDRDLLSKLDLKAPYTWLATWGGLGFFRPAPGTWGTLGALPPGLIALKGFGLPGLLVLILAVTLAGLWASRKFEERTQTHDNSSIVIDEVAGMMIALSSTGGALLPVVAAFALFRFFDILKPWPVGFIDRKIPGAPGIMCDDLAAGCMAAICVLGLRYAGLG